MLPVIGTLNLAGDFITGQLESIRSIEEVRPPYAVRPDLGPFGFTRVTSWLLLLTGPCCCCTSGGYTGARTR